MNNQFYKGRTNNHLTWVMVDATDFATPESALSAAMTIKIYGKLRGATGVNFVSSGTGSLTNDIQHVGASATGIYTIALAKADLSDASAAWYDQYTVVLAGTGAAQQVLVVDGGIDLSAVSSYQSRLSDILSQLTVVQSLASDAHSAAVVAQALTASDLSDIRSAIAAGPAATVTASDISDIASAVRAAIVSDLSDILSAATAGASRALLNQSRISDVQSYLVALSGTISDIYSLASNINSATLVAADVSDFASAVWAEKYTANSAASSFGSMMSDLYSRLVVIQSMASDAHSAAVVAQGLNASDLSDLRSAIAAVTASVSASDMSDIASRVGVVLASDLSDLLSRTTQINSRVLVSQSSVSDIYSLLSDVSSDLTVMSGVLSDTYSAVIAPGASALSDIASAVWARAGADPTTVPATTANMGAKVDWLTALSRNKITQNSAVQSLRNDADAADIASAAVSDDGTTFTRNKFA
jgi:hypothetical protein